MLCELGMKLLFQMKALRRASFQVVVCSDGSISSELSPKTYRGKLLELQSARPDQTSRCQADESRTSSGREKPWFQDLGVWEPTAVKKLIARKVLSLSSWCLSLFVVVVVVVCLLLLPPRSHGHIPAAIPAPPGLPFLPLPDTRGTPKVRKPRCFMHNGITYHIIYDAKHSVGLRSKSTKNQETYMVESSIESRAT